MTQEDMVRIKRILSKIARDNKLDLKVPLGVWDAQGGIHTGMFGVLFEETKDVTMSVNFEADKRMGPTLCRASATFTLDPSEQGDDAKIAAKANTAVAALKSNIVVAIRPKPQEKAA